MSEASSIFGVQKKLQRAESHIHKLQEELTRFVELKPYTGRVDKDTHGGNLVARLVAIRSDPIIEPDVQLILLAGEAIYQIRSALDHLIHQLVIANGQRGKLQNSRSINFRSSKRLKDTAPERQE